MNILTVVAENHNEHVDVVKRCLGSLYLSFWNCR